MNSLIHQVGLYYRTLRHLTLRQLYYQVVHRLKKLINKQNRNIESGFEQIRTINLLASIPSVNSYLGNHTFIFLNMEKTFQEKIDWDFIGYEKLWVYNLNYFDYLNQRQISLKESIYLIDEFCDNYSQRRQGTEPYPISLRGINWIKFFSFNKINNQRYNVILYSDYNLLANNLEYHLLGNHLLENGFSLLFGAYYFKSENFYKKSISILYDELEEQILEDGAHFELSPMYHQIILFRLLDCINLVRNNSWNENHDLLRFIEGKARKMLGWIEAVSFKNGDVPMVNDSAYGIAPSSFELLDYGRNLDVYPEKISLSTSGYRMIRQEKFELFIDIGNIGPDYIPGHAHSDTFNFILYVKDRPLLVDTGISTYNRNKQRILERSTISHNTVKVNGHEQSEMWASFRVGRRAKVTNTKESFLEISATHNGYEFLGIEHKRTWQWDMGQLKIIDEILGKSTGLSNEAYFHFHPEIDVQIQSNSVTAGSITLHFSHPTACLLDDYDFSIGFNRSQKAKKLIVSFTQKLESTITISH
jgi:hypothetical protein